MLGSRGRLLGSGLHLGVQASTNHPEGYHYGYCVFHARGLCFCGVADLLQLKWRKFRIPWGIVCVFSSADLIRLPHAPAKPIL